MLGREIGDRHDPGSPSGGGSEDGGANTTENRHGVGLGLGFCDPDRY